MTVAVAHQVSSATTQAALELAAREAALRASDLAVLHVVQSLDLDVSEAYQQGLSDDVGAVLASIGAPDLAWQLYLGVGDDDEVAERILDLAEQAGADLLVVGGRRRSPVGKFLLGSVTQTVILRADVSVVVVKPAR